MDSYISDLRFHIQKFLYYIIKITARWVNKPKFHMLLHLPDSIERFGPASLFAAEKFESYNGVLRNASIHSNRQSPGKDIAVTFANYKVLRHLMCGGLIRHPKKPGKYVSAAAAVSQLFVDNPSIQRSMDYNDLLAQGDSKFPHPVNAPLAPADKGRVPAPLKLHLPGREFFQLKEIQLNAHRTLQKGAFFLVSGGFSTQSCTTFLIYFAGFGSRSNKQPTVWCMRWGPWITCGRPGGGLMSPTGYVTPSIRGGMWTHSTRCESFAKLVLPSLSTSRWVARSAVEYLHLETVLKHCIPHAGRCLDN
jgi:hypothetical protein